MTKTMLIYFVFFNGNLSIIVKDILYQSHLLKKKNNCYFTPWQPCFFTDQKIKHNFCKRYPKEQLRKIWLKSIKWFQRRRCLKKITDDGHRVIAIAHMTKGQVS